MGTFTRLYGDRLFHLLVVLAALALAGYALLVLGVQNLFNPTVWWQSIAVWFAVAIIAHDLILYPLYSLADRLLPRSRRGGTPSHHVRITNYVRVPTLAAGLLLVMFLPGIIEQGAPAYLNATGLTQQPYLSRWLLITAVLYLASACCYVVRIALRRRHSTTRHRVVPPQPARPPSSRSNPSTSSTP